MMEGPGQMNLQFFSILPAIFSLTCDFGQKHFVFILFAESLPWMMPIQMVFFKN